MTDFKLSKYRFSAVVAALMTVSSLTPVNDALAAERIDQIRIQGAERIETTTIMSYVGMQVGDELQDDTLNLALKRLFRTGLFADVNMVEKNGVVDIVVAENPIVNEISFEGNKKIKDENLLAEVQLRPRTVFTLSKITADVERLQEIYRLSGRFAAVIEPKIIKLDQNRVNVVFEITEGAKTRIRHVNFIGNKEFDDEKLKTVIRSKESAWYRFISSDDKYDPDRLTFDKELLRRYYMNLGFADFQVTSAVAELSRNQEDFYVTFTIEEGKRYKVRDVKIESHIEELPSDLLADHLMMEKGDWYNAGLVDENVVKLADEAGNLQYAFVDVRPKVERSRDEQKVDIVYNLNEGEKAFVERININGNVRTMDEVVRREMLLVEGDAYNNARLKKSETQIKDLGFFEDVKVEKREGSSPDKTIIDISVQEKSTGELSLGAGFSSSDGPLANFGIKERNLLGKGQELSLSATLSGLRNELDLSFTEPYFLNRDLSATVDLFHITRDLQDESSYDQKQSGFGFAMGYPIAKNWRQKVGYRLERNQITDVQADASLFISEQEGDRLTSAISQTLTYDTRDSKLQTTSGLLASWTADLAGFGGDARYLKNRIGAKYYYPLAKQWVLRLEGEGGYIASIGGEDVQINERFFLGGANLRGFERSGVGPRDQATGDALGGNWFTRGSVEMGFPSGLPEDLGIRGHLFSDFGTLTDVDSSGAGIQDDDTIRVSVGAGVSWRSPMGPIRVDMAVPVVDEDYDVDEFFRFGFGAGF